MSRRVAPSKFFQERNGGAAHCKVCKDAGLPMSAYNSHNVRDVKGLVCCPTLKSNKCWKCDGLGHFAGSCPGKKEVVKVVVKSRDAVKSLDDTVKLKVKVVPASRGRFADLSDGVSSDEEDEKVSADPPPANVTVRLKASQMNWEAESDDEEW